MRHRSSWRSCRVTTCTLRQGTWGKVEKRVRLGSAIMRGRTSRAADRSRGRHSHECCTRASQLVFEPARVSSKSRNCRTDSDRLEDQRRDRALRHSDASCTSLLTPEAPEVCDVQLSAPCRVVCHGLGGTSRCLNMDKASSTSRHMLCLHRIKPSSEVRSKA